MKNFFIKVLIIMFAFFIIYNICELKSYAKYVINDRETIIKIKNADSEVPKINGRNYNVDYEIFNKNITINYEDNIKVKQGKYWYNPNNKEFNEEGKIFETGKEFLDSGWYKILVEDLYQNKTEYIFLIDKEVNSANIIASDADDTGSNFEIQATDILSGIKEINIFIENRLYKTYTYSEKFISSVKESLFVLVEDLPFYESAYIEVKDFCDNTIISNMVIPNKTRIVLARDLAKFRNVINNKIDNFKDKTVYLIKDINMKDLCNNQIGSWVPIALEENMFQGTFYGNNKKISNFYINNLRNNAGLFGINNGIILNFTLSGEFYGISGNNRGTIAGINYGSIESCDVDANIFSNCYYQGGIVGRNYGLIKYCNMFGKIVGDAYTGGICGYNQAGRICCCSNQAEVLVRKNFVGGIAGFTTNTSENEIAIEKCFNEGRIVGDEYTGGICGAAWGDETKVIKIRYCYNTGILKPYLEGYIEKVGGILGGTYYDYSKKQIYNHNNIMYCYNIGKIEVVNDFKANQIVSSYANVVDCYYPSNRANSSGLGIPKDINLFKEPISNNRSIIYLLEKASSNIWDINFNCNNGYLCLKWQLEIIK